MYLVKFKGCQKLGWTKEVDTYFEELVKRVSEYRQYQVCKRYQQPCSEEQEVNLPVVGRLFHYKQVWKELNIQNFCKANNSIKHIAKSSRNAFALERLQPVHRCRYSSKRALFMTILFCAKELFSMPIHRREKELLSERVHKKWRGSDEHQIAYPYGYRAYSAFLIIHIRLEELIEASDDEIHGRKETQRAEKREYFEYDHFLDRAKKKVFEDATKAKDASLQNGVEI
ncbi:hypothetical protein ACTFIR_011895 [Dictyostelium discoideum]